jgi:hypothetical protein
MLCSLIVCLSRVHVIARSEVSDGRWVFQISRCISQDFRVVLGGRKNSPVAETAGEPSDQAGFVVVVYVEPVPSGLLADGASAALVFHECLILTRRQAVGLSYAAFV